MEEGLARLEHRLLNPPHRVDLSGLLDLWQHDDVVAICRRPKHLEDAPDLPLRIRGALGNMLERRIGDRFDTPGPFGRPDAHRLLYSWQAPNVGNLQIAQSYIVLSDVERDRVEIRVRLFGLASWHAPAVIEALIAGLETGVSLKNHGIRVPFEVVEGRVERFCGAARAWTQSAGFVRLDLRTPLIIRSGQRIQITPEALMRAICRRAEALAPWMQCTVDLDYDELGRASREFDYSMASIRPESWYRTTRRDPGKPKAIEGYGGKVTIAGDLRGWTPLIELAGHCSIGSETSLGMGAVKPTFLP